MYGYVRRGALAGLAGGLVYGLFAWFVGNRLIAAAEAFEHHAGDPAVPGLVTTVGSVAASALWGLLLGIAAFGVAYYVFEPAIPGRTGTKSYLLGAAGFLTVSGAPWLVLPPQPPGVEQALPTGTRIALYVAAMVAGALACGLAGYTYNRLQSARSERSAGRLPAALVACAPFALLAVPVVLAPANPTSGPIPADLAGAFRAVVVAGQLGLWVVTAGVHARLVRRDRRDRDSVWSRQSPRPRGASEASE